METKDVKEFYNATLSSNINTYEQERWESSSQAKASYIATKNSLLKNVPELVKSSKDILELGPGPGTWTKELLQLRPNASYTLVDISSEMLKQAKSSLFQHENIEFLTADILDFVPAKKYDFFFSSRMIEYVPEKRAALKRVIESLSVDARGYIVTKTPQSKRPFSKKVNSLVHQNQISAADFTALLKSLDCDVLLLKSVTSVFPGARSGVLDQWLSALCQRLPFFLCRYVSESYVIVFKKNN